MPLLRIENLVKRYNGLTVTDDLSLDIVAGELHAIIGPNGAGKTTLIAQLAGQIAPNSGRIHFGGRDIAHDAPPDRARAGIARSFQITSIFPSFTALANVALAVQGRRRHSFRFWRPAERDPTLVEPARRLLAEVGLDARRDTPARTLSHGEHRLLELAIALAQEPKLLLLDEPMAGLGSEESKGLVEFLRTLKGRYTIILVEHDMDAVFALADRISVLSAGRIIATGLPDAIRRNAEVRAAYLGDEMPDAAG
ncbi:MAG: ABC transporter ATP-binding protein [Candidatus Eiseniibacteriota bacterium]